MHIPKNIPMTQLKEDKTSVEEFKHSVDSLTFTLLTLWLVS